MYEYKVKEVVDVYDGDTFSLQIDVGFKIFHNIKVRLNGANCPEIHTKDKREKALGFKAKQFTEDFLKDAEEITLITEKKGKFGRWLGSIRADGFDLATMLIEEGLAREYHGEKRGPWFE